MADDDVNGVRHEQQRRRRVRRHRHPLVGVVVALTLVVGAAIATAAVLVAAPSDLLTSCDLATTRPRITGADSFLYAGDGRRLGAVPTARNREPVPLANVSHWMQPATVAVEDRRFWEHGALDYAGIVRAAVADVQAGRTLQGGSTITQQLVRARYMPGERMTLPRKLTQACLAVKLARRWTKPRILEEYLNTVFYGHRAYGVEAAAQTYFARSAARLTLSEAALLAGLPQAP